MITQLMIDEIEGILILLTRQADKRMLNAIGTLPKEEIKAYRDSLIEEWEVTHPNKSMLTLY